MTHLKQKFPIKGAKWLQDKHHRSFISWFHEHVSTINISMFIIEHKNFKTFNN